VTLKIATWNVNSARARVELLSLWLKESAPDIALLQELKCQDSEFPRLEVESLGYQVKTHGQKTYNGVAILAKTKIEIVRRGLPGDDADEQARYIEADVAGLRVASIYLPNGNPAPSPKFDYKLAWMKRLDAHAHALLALEKPVVLGGDYNVCPANDDLWDPKAMEGDALVSPEARAAWRALVHQGWTDALRHRHPAARLYTYWDYFRDRFTHDHGLRIDHLLLSPEAADRLVEAGVDRSPRKREKPSDHTPAWIELRG
jgi:exodeoxyribonuclease-3